MLELADLIRVRDATAFFVIPTEAIAAKGQSKILVVSSATTAAPPSTVVHRPKSGRKSIAVDSEAGSSKTMMERPVQQLDRTSKRNSDVRGLPLLNPSNRQPPMVAPSKSSSSSVGRTKLPKLNIRKPAAVKEKSQPISLPPLSARSNSSSVSLVHDVDETRSRKNSASGSPRQEADAEESTALDYSFLAVQQEKAIVEWKRLYSKRMLQVVVTWLRSQLDQLRYSVVPPSNHKSSQVVQHHSALFLLQAQLNHTSIELSPSLDEIQDVVHSAGKIMLSLAKGFLFNLLFLQMSLIYKSLV